MIHLENASEVFLPKNIWVWLVAAFKAGFINSAGFLASGMFVSHMTGFGTQAGIALGTENYFFSIELLIIPFFFVLGGVTTSLILDRNYNENETPPYWLVQGLITLLIGGVLLLGTEHSFRGIQEFGIEEFVLMAILCMVCGLKNSLVSWSTFGRVKVTHLTGISTDIGLQLVRSFYPKQPAPRGRESRVVNISRFLTLVSFTAGAGISAVLFPSLEFKVFYIVFVISLLMTIYSCYHARQLAKKKLHLSAEPAKA